MDALTADVIQTSLRAMFESTHFDVCTIDKCLKLANAVPNKADRDKMHALHCVHYSEMSDDIRRWLFYTSVNMMSGFRFDMDQLALIGDKAPIVIEGGMPNRLKMG